MRVFYEKRSIVISGALHPVRIMLRRDAKDSLFKLVNYKLRRTVVSDLILQILRNRTMGGTEVNGWSGWQQEAHGTKKYERRATCATWTWRSYRMLLPILSTTGACEKKMVRSKFIEVQKTGHQSWCGATELLLKRMLHLCLEISSAISLPNVSRTFYQRYRNYIGLALIVI